MKKAVVYSEELGRMIRNESFAESGVSSWVRIKEAIEEGRLDDALDLVDYLLPEGKRLHDLMCDWVYSTLDFIAKKMGEETLYEAIRYAGEVIRRPYINHIKELPVEKMVYLQAEGMRSHRSGPGELGNIEITEERDRYVLSFDPCGSGGRMRRKGQLDGLPPRTAPPFNLGMMSKPYPWSWGKAGVPYYCLHCCIWSEILPIEWIGYPIRITEYSDDPEKPCRFLFYKDPEQIPEHYFERVGKKKGVKSSKS